MKINTDYDGKRIRVELEAPSEDLKKFLSQIAGFVASWFEEEKKVDGPKKVRSKKGGES